MDTGVISYMTGEADQRAEAYWRLLGRARIALSFQVIAELLSGDFSATRQRMIDDTMAAVVQLPNSYATSERYAQVARIRKLLRRGQRDGADAGDADVWIISSALQYGLPLISHDRQQVALGRAAGLPVHTALTGLRADNPA